MSGVIYEEVTLFLVCLLLGTVLGIFYDGFRVLRLFVPHKNWVVDVEDLLFWVGTAWLVFRTLFYYNQGVLRAYAFVGILVGVVLYYLTVSKILLFLAKKMLPFWNRVLYWMRKPFVFIREFLQKTLKNMITEVKMALKGR